MWEDVRYYWVVLCKNRWRHVRENIFWGHRIPLGETDAFAPPPSLPLSLNGRFSVRCDSCGKEYQYRLSELRRVDHGIPESFTPHPLFR